MPIASTPPSPPGHRSARPLLGSSFQVRIAREVQADPDRPRALKRAPGDVGPDETTELIALWHKARRSLLKSRQHLLNEAESILIELPEAIRVTLPDTGSF